MEILYRVEQQKAVIERCLGEEERIDLPEYVDGHPVYAVDAYAFSDAGGRPAEGRQIICGERLKEIRLPRSMRRIGNYAFYGCRNLEKLTLHHQTDDIAGGAFTGCHRVAELELYMEDAFGYCLKDIVSELRGELKVILRYAGEDAAYLLFPEYYEEAVENTPARILETHFHGSGYHYRQCFRDGALYYPEYDGLFTEAMAWESLDFCMELALLRLRHPHGLTKDAAGRYRSFLMEHRMDAAGWCIYFEQEEALEYISGFIDWSAQELTELIRAANEKGRIAMQSFLMDYKHAHTQTRRRTFEL